MNRLFAHLLLFLPFVSYSQYQYQRLNHINHIKFAKSAYSLESDLHTSVKPFNLNRADSSATLPKPKRTGKGWWSRKLFYKNLAEFKGEDYHFTINPVFNFRLGTESSNDKILYTNTRGFNIEGKIGEKFSFYTSFLENQAEFPTYIRTQTLQTQVVPGQGFAREFGTTSFDFGMASAEMSYNPNKYFNFTLGQGRNFFGEGYRSMFLSDGGFNYPFFRIETNIWKFKYTNLWAQTLDVNNPNNPNDVFDRKYLSSHYLSININKRLNLSFFEAVIVADSLQQRGVDVSFFNPVIFYRPIEFASGSGTGNVIMGFAASYKLNNTTQAYGQFALDEFKASSVLSNNGDFRNKFAWQLGIKQFDVMGVENLFLRLEYNAARPYIYSHNRQLTNYAHYGQPLAHPWGGNFNELVLHSFYHFKRWEFEARYHLGIMGLDTNNSNWGSDIFKSYNNAQAFGNDLGQGVRGYLHYLLLRAAWVANPVTQLKLEAGVQIRSLSTDFRPTSPLPSGNSNYVFLGLRTEFFNRYYDF